MNIIHNNIIIVRYFAILWKTFMHNISHQHLTAITASRPKLLRDRKRHCCTHLIEMLWVDLPEAAGGRLAERTGPAWAGPRAGVGPGPVSWGDLEPRGWRRTARGPVEMRGRGLAQSLLGRRWSGAGVHGLKGDLGVVKVLFSLGLIWPTVCVCVCGKSVKMCVWQTSGHRVKRVSCLFGLLLNAARTVAQIWNLKNQSELQHTLKILFPLVFLMLLCSWKMF